jgi:hypothetical protein
MMKELDIEIEVGELRPLDSSFCEEVFFFSSGSAGFLAGDWDPFFAGLTPPLDLLGDPPCYEF